MKLNQIVVVIALSMLATAATAESTTQATQSPTSVNVTVNTSATDTDAQSAAQKPAATSAQPTATTVTPVPAPAVGDKKIEAIRKVRQEVELKNDDKVVEKLEKTRLDEEKQLATKVDTLNLKPTEAPAPAAPVPANEPPIVKIEKVDVIQQPAGPAVAPVAAKVEEKPVEDKKQWYAGIGTGQVLYSGNITQKSNVGLMVGKMLDDHMAIEGSLTYSTFSLNNYWNTAPIYNTGFGDVDQYDLGVALKYYLLNNGSFRPYVGGSGDYILRDYKDGYANYYSNYSNDTQSTNSLNAGLMAGLDFQITSRLLIGGEFKYSLPIYYQNNGYITQSYLEGFAKPLEQTTFTSWLLSVKFLF